MHQNAQNNAQRLTKDFYNKAVALLQNPVTDVQTAKPPPEHPFLKTTMSKSACYLAKAELSPNLVTAFEEFSSAFAAVRQAAAVIYVQAGLGSSLFFTKMRESRILVAKR